MLNVTNIRECESKPQWHPSRVPVPKKQKTSICKDAEKLEPLYTVGGNAEWCAIMENMKVPQKIKTGITIWPSNPRILKRYLYSRIHHSIMHNSQEVAATQISTDR